MRPILWRRLPVLIVVVGPAAWIGLSAWAAETAPTAEQIKFFENRIRPALVDHCYQCHSQGAKEIQGSFRLDSAVGLRRGGDSGPAIVPGYPAKSLLIKAISYQDADRQMPPKDAGGKLPDAVIRDFETWVKMGAPDPRTRTGRGRSGGRHLRYGKGQRVVVLSAAQAGRRTATEKRRLARE